MQIQFKNLSYANTAVLPRHGDIGQVKCPILHFRFVLRIQSMQHLSKSYMQTHLAPLIVHSMIALHKTLRRINNGVDY